MAILLLGFVLWYLGDAIAKMAVAGQSTFDYWANRERERIGNEYGDDCEWRDE